MNNIDYVNIKIENSSFYQGPKTLFKYRPFDKWTFDMLDNTYLYFCPAEEEDDETECITKLENIVGLTSEVIRYGIIEVILSEIRPYVDIYNYELFRQLVYQCTNQDKTVRPKDLLECAFELQKYSPYRNIAPIINYLSTIPNSVNYNVFKQFYILILKAINARKEMGICALSERPDIDDLWERYADNSTGYCVEYEIENNERITNDLFPVIYEEEREYGILIALCRNYVNSCMNKMNVELYKRDISQYLRLFITKYEKWSGQKEWRILGSSKEHREAPKIKKIFLGKNISEENYLAIKKFCDDKEIEYIKL